MQQDRMIQIIRIDEPFYLVFKKFVAQFIQEPLQEKLKNTLLNVFKSDKITIYRTQLENNDAFSIEIENESFSLVILHLSKSNKYRFRVISKLYYISTELLTNKYDLDDYSKYPVVINSYEEIFKNKLEFMQTFFYKMNIKSRLISEDFSEYFMLVTPCNYDILNYGKENTLITLEEITIPYGIILSNFEDNREVYKILKEKTPEILKNDYETLKDTFAKLYTSDILSEYQWIPVKDYIEKKLLAFIGQSIGIPNVNKSCFLQLNKFLDKAIYLCTYGLWKKQTCIIKINKLIQQYSLYKEEVL